MLKVVASYMNEVRTIEAEPHEVIFRYEIATKLINKKCIDLRNDLVSTIGTKLEALLPVNDEFDSMKKIEVYDNGVLVKESSNIINVLYRVATANSRDIAVGNTSPHLTENLIVDIL